MSVTPSAMLAVKTLKRILPYGLVMDRFSFQELAKLRVSEAKVLLERHYYAGAYYFSGFAIECALKACIARKSKRFDFPDKSFVSKCHTHNLETLFELAGIKQDRDDDIRAIAAFRANWVVVKDWDIENSRYRSSIPELQARDLYSAVTSRKHGILAWLKKRW